jgi:excisionase family DNA binding protein
VIPSSEDPILTPEEAAEILRVPVSTVRQLLAEGRLVGVKVGRRWRLRRSAIEALVPSVETTGTTAGAAVSAPSKSFWDELPSHASRQVRRAEIGRRLRAICSPEKGEDAAVSPPGTEEEWRRRRGGPRNRSP